MKMRISRALALGGIDSRRKCEVHVRNGAVIVNGEVVRDLGRQVDPETDEILFRGKHVMRKTEKFVYYLLNKPMGYTTTAADPHAEQTVFDLLPRILVRGTHHPGENKTRVFPVGRLDKNSTGLLLFTNDGDLAHPRYEVGKWYQVKLERAFDMRDKAKLLAGIRIEGGMAKVKELHRLTPRNVKLLICEGKKREVRRIFEAIGYEVRNLVRMSFGSLELGDLMPGRGRYLKPIEIEKLQETVAQKASSKAKQ